MANIILENLDRHTIYSIFHVESNREGLLKYVAPYNDWFLLSDHPTYDGFPLLDIFKGGFKYSFWVDPRSIENGILFKWAHREGIHVEDGIAYKKI